MDYKAIFADVDGTLVAAGAHPVTRASDRVISSVTAAQIKGVLFSLASARSFKWVSGLIASLNIKAPLILDNGARVYDTRIGKYIFENYIGEAKVKEIITCAKNLSIVLHIVDVYKGEERRFDYDFSNPPSLGEVVKTMVLQISAEDADSLYKELIQIPGIQVTKSISNHDPVQESVHVTTAGATKEKALEWVLENEKLLKEEIIGIGDSYNDKEFLKGCGLKVAMGNSVPEIKAIADYIAPSFGEDGVADVIERFILGK